MWNTVHSSGPWLAYVALLLAIAAGLAVNILGLPGLWLIVVAVIAYGWAFGFAYIGWWTIGIVTALAVLAEVVEFVAGAAGSKRAGGSKRGMAGAIVGGIVGGIVGTPIFPIVGTIVGSVVGSFAGAYLVEFGIGRPHEDAVAISVGAAKGRVWGMVFKTLFGVAMGGVAAFAGLPLASRRPAPLPPAVVAPPATLPATTSTSSRPVALSSAGTCALPGRAASAHTRSPTHVLGTASAPSVTGENCTATALVSSSSGSSPRKSLTICVTRAISAAGSCGAFANRWTNFGIENRSPVSLRHSTTPSV